jgi:hypothetical protein
MTRALLPWALGASERIDDPQVEVARRALRRA